MRASICLAGVIAALGGCSSSHDAPRDANSGPANSAGDAGDDPNGTMETARAVRVGDFPGALDTIDGPSDKDFFSFAGTAGQWVSIRSTDTSGFSVSDTVLTLFDPDRRAIAQNRYVASLVGENVLARIVTRLPATGTYWVSASDSHAPDAANGFTQVYRLSVVDAAAIDGYVVDAEPSSGPTDATPIQFHHWDIAGSAIDDAFVLGDFSSGADVDVFSFEIPVGAARLLNAQVDPSFATGDGATVPPGRIWVTDEAGLTTIGRIDNSTGQASLVPALGAGKHLLWVAHPETAATANDFYVIRAMLAPENDSVTASAGSTLTDAKSLPVQADGNGGTGLSAYFLTNVDSSAGSYFEFDGKAGLTASVYCSSARDGSGVVGLRVSARDEADSVLGEASETRDAALSLDGVVVPESGRLFLRMTKDTQLADVAGSWVRCVVSAG
jgi:hypothetical protein